MKKPLEHAAYWGSLQTRGWWKQEHTGAFMCWSRRGVFHVASKMENAGL